MLDIYEFFNSRDIAAHCRSIGHNFTATEMAYIVWNSNHHTLEEKHQAWTHIIESMPDEAFPPAWSFDGHTLHSFLRVFMRLQREFMSDFMAQKEPYIYSYAVLEKNDCRYRASNILFDSVDACLETLKINELNANDEIVKIELTRRRVYSSAVSWEDALEENITFDPQLNPLEIHSDYEMEGVKKFLCPIYGFFDMWVAIPTPFGKGDIVVDVNTYSDVHPGKHLPFVLDRIPYWEKDAQNGDNCEEETARLLLSGVDTSDMAEYVYFLNEDGEVYLDNAFCYLDLEYCRDELEGNDRRLKEVSRKLAQYGSLGDEPKIEI